MWKTYISVISKWSKVRYATCLTLIFCAVLYALQHYESGKRRLIAVTVSDGSEVEAALTYNCTKAIRHLSTAEPLSLIFKLSSEIEPKAEPIRLTQEQSRRIIGALQSQKTFRHNEPCLCIPWCWIQIHLKNGESLLINFHIHPDADLSYFCGRIYESINLAPATFDSIYKVVHEVANQKSLPY